MNIDSQNNTNSNNEVTSYKDQFGYTLKVKEVADILNLHPHAVYKLLRQNKIPYKRPTWGYIIPRDPFFNWLHDINNNDNEPIY